MPLGIRQIGQTGAPAVVFAADREGGARVMQAARAFLAQGS
jgi:hypothetical protein